MRLSLDQRTDVALRALRALEVRAATTRGRDLAQELGTSPQYLPHVLRPLVRAGWVDSDPGPRGGYRLARPLAEHSMLALIEVMEGPSDLRICVLRSGPCGLEDRCAMHDAWLEARDALLQRLDATPLGAPDTT